MTERRDQALDVLKNLLIALPGLTADIFYQALRDGGFSEDEAVKLTGSCIRTASARNWMVKTTFSKNSQRNHSNLQNIWRSKLYADGEISKKLVTSWQKRGFVVPIDEVALWDSLQVLKSR